MTVKNNMDNTDSDLQASKEPVVFSVVGKIIIYLFFLALWFFVGGFYSVGPRIAHNIENAVGALALDGTFVLWVALPVTCLIAITNSNVFTRRAFVFNAVLWLLFLAYLYIRWDMAYP